MIESLHTTAFSNLPVTVVPSGSPKRDLTNTPVTSERAGASASAG